MSYNTIEVSSDARGIATLTLARPEKHNAMNSQMMAEITTAAKALGADEKVRAVVLAAQGKSFCAGADLNWMRAQVDQDRAGKISEARVLATMLATLNNLPKPLIGRVEGNAYGGGIGMMAVCDIVVAVKGARFALTETKLGLIPATIGPFVLRRLSETYARQVFFTAKSFETELALRAGLVSAICAADEMDAAIEAEIKPILQTAPGAVAEAKALLQQMQGRNIENDIELTVNALADRWETDEAQQRIAAFFKDMT
ncbi:MAG: crotonase/enoyl-CoA hydratase family protein [Amylibacter sp.]|nr:crotonase/enoyl-CoA hydratase family protein [Amylibacter sp.]